MTKFVRTLDTMAAKRSACDIIMRAPFGWVCEVRERKRTNDQNSKLWAMLTDISLQCELQGRKRPPEEWKVAVMHALNHEQRFIPSLDGQAYIPLGYSSSNLSIPEMRDLIEFVYQYGAENNVVWSDEGKAA